MNISNIQQIGESELRLLANLEQHYLGWLQAERIIAPGRLTWKTVAGKEYLYRIVDGAGNGRSLGPRDDASEAQFTQWQTAKEQVGTLSNRMLMDGAQYRAMRLPILPAFAGQALRQLDIAGQLGDHGVLVVGTNALVAYAIEAQMRLGTDVTATDDFDLTWASADLPRGRPVFDVLKEADRTWTVNQERPFQALNARGDELELLLPKQLAKVFPRGSGGLLPIPLPEQDWLLPGRRVEHVVACSDRKPARVMAPDPRWFALHKLWLADKPERNPLKKPKDRAQGEQLLDLVAERMPHYPLDEEFAQALPAELIGYFERWQDENDASPRPK